eukprot:12535106-Prorocentrum_lima.AAC.1
MIEAPELLVKLGIVKKGTAWMIKQKTGSSEGERHAQSEECTNVLRDLIRYSDHWKGSMYL